MDLFSTIETIKSKSQPVTEAMVMNAYKSVKRGGKSAGIDDVSFTDFGKDLRANLYKVWNRMASGSYFPPAVKEVEIPKTDGSKRKLGIPTISDRIAQTVVKEHLNKTVDSKFEKNSYGYRKGKSAQTALQKCKENCWQYAWAIDIDIKGFFDNISKPRIEIHELFEAYGYIKVLTLRLKDSELAPIDEQIRQTFLFRRFRVGTTMFMSIIIPGLLLVGWVVAMALSMLVK